MYSCGIYIRTSKNVVDENNSLNMQESIIRKFIDEREDLKEVKVYIDDGFSGLDFNRPGFNKLMEDVDNGLVNCVVVKDLSRLGRDYIQTGMYIQYIFPSMGVRLIAINDRYDSKNASEIDKYFMVPLRNYINDAYSKDISIKVRSSLYMKMKKGECIVSKVPYGYVRQGEIYIIVEELRDVIKNMYKLSLEGYSLQGISNILNRLNIITPCGYRRLNGDNYKTPFINELEKKDKYCWYPMMVKRILTDKIYIGALVQGKVEKYSYKIKKRKYKDEKEWFCHYNHHEGIIDDKFFFVVNNNLRLDIRRRKGKVKCSQYSGIVRCGICRNGLYYKNERYSCIGCNKKFRIESSTGGTAEIKIMQVILDRIIKRMIELIDIEDLKKNINGDRCSIAMNVREIHIYNTCMEMVLYYE